MARHHGKAAGGQSVTGHPLFPALVALWFGALFGLGSLAIRPALLEQLVLDFGVDTIIPAAAPPLGTTFRILLALAMSAAGAILGAVIARRIRRSPRPAATVAPRRARDAHPDAPPRRPISAREEFGDEQFIELPDTGPQPIPGRRRALAIAEETRPSDFHEYAPLPGAPSSDAFDATARLDALVEKLGPDLERGEVPLELAPEDEEPSFDAPTMGGAFAPPEEGPRESNEHLPFGRPLEIGEPPFAEPLADFASEPELNQTFAAPRPFAGPADLEPVESPDNVPGIPASAAARLVDRSLETLSTAELSERLAIALELRRQRQAAAVMAREAAAAAAEVAESGPKQEPEPEPAPTYSAPPMPAALRPLDLAFEDEAGEDEGFGTLPPSHRFGLTAMAPAAHASADEPEAVPGDDDALNDAALADGYSSLLDLSRPAALRGEFVRIEDEPDDDAAIEPVVTFPGQAARRAAATSPAAHAQPEQTVRPNAAAEPALRRFDAPPAAGRPAQPTSLGSPAALDREEADRALRAALATLQRMSGAA